MLRKPKQLGKAVVCGGDVAADAEVFLRTNGVDDRGNFLPTPGIVTQNGDGTNRPFIVNKDKGFSHGCDAEGGDRITRGRRKGTADSLRHSGFHFRHREFGPARSPFRTITDGTSGQAAAINRIHDSLAPRGAHIYPEQAHCSLLGLAFTVGHP